MPGSTRTWRAVDGAERNRRGICVSEKTPKTPWRNRIVGEGEQQASQFIANPNNWRTHPQNQRDAMRGALNEVGWVQRVIVNRRTGYLIDGHERVWEALQNGDAAVPFVEVDLDEAEEAYVLATLDPIGAMAAADAAKLDDLLRDVQSGEAGVQQMLEQIAAKAGLIPPNDPMAEWQGMPEFENENALGEVHHLTMHFATVEDIADFARLIGQAVTVNTTYLWHPRRERENLKAYSAHEP